MTSEKIKIGVDIYGSDQGPKVLIKGAYNFALKNTDVIICLFGEKHEIRKIFNDLKIKKLKNIELYEGKNSVKATDSPLMFRHRSDSALIKAMNYLRKDELDALLSCNSSGFLLAAGIFIVKTINKRTRPFFCAIIPKGGKDFFLLADCGANLQLNCNQFLEMAHLCKAHFQHQWPKKKVRIGMLNVGEETTKGTSEMQKIHHELKKQFNNEFKGNVEAQTVFTKNLNIVLANGLLGNVFLKTLEGTAKKVGNELRTIIKSSIISSLGGLLIRKQLLNVKKQLDYRNYPGALILGLRHVIMKAHGNTNENNVEESLVFLLKGLVAKQKDKANSNKLVDVEKRSLTQELKSGQVDEIKRIIPMLNKYNIHARNHYIYLKALTHISWAREHNNYLKDFHYERLEHTGDKAINYYVTRKLDKMYPNLDQGEISKINARIICNKNLSIVAQKMNFSQYVRFGKSFAGVKNVSDKIWASFFEGFIGAIIVDINDNTESINILESIVNDVIFPIAHEKKLFSTNQDFKTQLQEYVKAQNPRNTISYKTISHASTKSGNLFVEALFINKKLVLKTAGYKKIELHQKIAKKYLKHLQEVDAKNKA